MGDFSRTSTATTSLLLECFFYTLISASPADLPASTLENIMVITGL
jgi:hypothetical protein